MQKGWLLIVLLFILSGCVIVNDEIVNEQLNTTFEKVAEIGVYHQNNTMPYYDYYLPSGLSERELDSDSIVLKYNESVIIMNLNISNIINEEFYTDATMKDEGFFNSECLLYEKQGSYQIDNKEKTFLYRLYKYDEQYFLHLLTSDLNFYGSVQLSDVNSLTKYLLVMMKNVSVNKEQVIANYANTGIIEYTKKQIDLFDTAVPVSGELSEILIDGAIIGNQDLQKDGQITDDENNNGAPIE